MYSLSNCLQYRLWRDAWAQKAKEAIFQLGQASVRNSLPHTAYLSMHHESVFLKSLCFVLVAGDTVAYHVEWQKLML
jgi:hypothetical protein